MVEQVDVNRAKELWNAICDETNDWDSLSVDEQVTILEAFRDHRIAAEARGMEKAAKIVDRWEGSMHTRQIAETIRKEMNGGQHE